MVPVLHINQHHCVHVGLGNPPASGHQLLAATLSLDLFLVVWISSLWIDHLPAIDVHRFEICRHRLYHHLLLRSPGQQGHNEWRCHSDAEALCLTLATGRPDVRLSCVCQLRGHWCGPKRFNRCRHLQWVLVQYCSRHASLRLCTILPARTLHG